MMMMMMMMTDDDDDDDDLFVCSAQVQTEVRSWHRRAMEVEGKETGNIINRVEKKIDWAIPNVLILQNQTDQASFFLVLHLVYLWKRIVTLMFLVVLKYKKNTRIFICKRKFCPSVCVREKVTLF